MEYDIVKWSIAELINLYEENKLDLNPPYQRNFIWSKKDQNELIDSILNRRFPLPTFFLRKIENGNFEMVDGQQRTRTILAYNKRNFKGETISELVEEEKENFENYKLSITIIENLEDSDSIEEFYARVNKTGRKLNKPELNKAEYFYTEFLDLNSILADSPEFKSLDLFTDASTRRMNDIDFISELIAQLEFGITEKKDKVDYLYENDINGDKKEELKTNFLQVITKIAALNTIYPIRKTRYRQRNDFYTLFGFINKYSELSNDSLKYYYSILVYIAQEISPSNDFCDPLKEYAINCVSQSNQKRARQKRLQFFEELLLNPYNDPNETQREIIAFYKLTSPNVLVPKGNYFTLNIDKLKEVKSSLIF
ncbi:MAG TPA: DUF262 domain-containing protein [Bacteroidales bacterium]|nr:DUF262 domain-containing protein [Bacteroidales bacterium]HRX96335.1 DUF262 domain-containing protein [Bacteroidales bacterium]